MSGTGVREEASDPPSDLPDLAPGLAGRHSCNHSVSERDGAIREVSGGLVPDRLAEAVVVAEVDIIAA